MLTVYNTMTRKKEEFHPLREGEVSIYCCGVTPYNDPHIGNARPLSHGMSFVAILHAKAIACVTFKTLPMWTTRSSMPQTARV